MDLNTVIKRFYSKTQRDELTGCLVWTGSVRHTGYALIQRNGKKYYVHRYAWLLEHGEIPTGLQVAHLCHNKRCVELSHLKLMTATENNRSNRLNSEANYIVKLSDEDVKDIKAMIDSDYSDADIAAHYDVTIRNINLIRNNITWKDVVPY